MLRPQSPAANRPSQIEEPVEAEGAALGGELRGRGGRPEQALDGIPRREPHQQEREGDHPQNDDGPGQGAGPQMGEHAPNLARPAGPR